MPEIKRRMIYIILGILALLPVILLALLSASAKEPNNLGVTNGRLAPCPDTPNCVSTQARDDQHRIAPIAFDGSSEEAMKRLKVAIGTMPRMRIVLEADDYLHVEAASRIFRFVDDVEFFVDRDAKDFHFRSASRVGRSDLGANRARMEQLRAAFNR